MPENSLPTNERLARILALPLHRYLGIRDLTSEQGTGTLTFTVGEAALNPAGRLHGGVIYTLSDVCAYAGLGSLLDADIEAVTHDIQVSVMRSAGPGDVVVFRSQVVRLGRRLCFIDVAATLAGSVVATARVTKSIVPAGAGGA